MKKFTYECFKRVDTIEDVKDQLLDLDNELKGTPLENLIAFNHTYFIITHNVYSQLGNNFFTEDNLIKKIDTRFGNYYFEALYGYIHNQTCPPAWRLTFECCQQNSTYSFIYMALGVNAHVNNDLPQTLYDVIKNTEGKKDYEKINKIIRSSIARVIKELPEKKLLLHSFEKLNLPLYSPLLNKTICHWRENAWNDYLDLRDSTLTVKTIEDNAEKIAKVLARIKHLYELPVLWRIY